VLLKSQLHPSLRKAYKILEKNFDKMILQDMDALGSLESASKMLALIPDDETRKSLMSKWENGKAYSSREKWDHIVSALGEKKVDFL